MGEIEMMDGNSSDVESLPHVAPSPPTLQDTKANGYSSRHLQCSNEQVRAQPGATTTTRMAYVVNSIKEGFRKLGAGVLASDSHHVRTARRRPPLINHGQITDNLAPDGGKYVRRAGGNVWGVKRKVKGGEEMSFEMYLSSLPKADPVDRTVHWLFHHHNEEAGSRDYESQRERNITSIIDARSTQLHTTLTHPAHFKVLQPVSRPGTSSWQQAGESSPYDTSLSYYESARGTGGRGTPPPRVHGQPRLDDLFRQLQVEREREARMKSQAQEERIHQQQQLATNNLQFPGYLAANKVPRYSAGIRHDLAPFTSQQTPFVLHKNSAYYNQGHTHQCEWGHCRMRFLSSKDVLTHIQDQHMSYLPASVKNRPIRSGQRPLVCEWRGCENSGRGYIARYKLLMHIKTAHVLSQQKKTDSHSAYWKR